MQVSRVFLHVVINLKFYRLVVEIIEKLKVKSALQNQFILLQVQRKNQGKYSTKEILKRLFIALPLFSTENSQHLVKVKSTFSFLVF